MMRTVIIVTGVYGFIGVAIGAFGAHAWRSKLPAERLEHVQTAVRYLFASLIGLVLVAVLSSDCEGGLFETIGAWSFGLGILVFSGSLITLALTGNRRWGAVTPIGGVLLLVGWAAVVGAALVTMGGAAGGFSLSFYGAC